MEKIKVLLEVSKKCHRLAELASQAIANNVNDVFSEEELKQLPMVTIAMIPIIVSAIMCTKQCHSIAKVSLDHGMITTPMEVFDSMQDLTVNLLKSLEEANEANRRH